MPRAFSKMHGAGNDFVLLDCRGDAPPDAALCRRLADRHTGVGCDQVLTIESPRDAGASAAYRIWNADGSPARQCGNGARCVAAWLARRGEAGVRFSLDSPSGRHAVERGPDGFRVELGVPDFTPLAIPLAGLAEADEYALDIAGAPVRFGAVSMGNPHAVIVVDDVAHAPVATLAPILQAHAVFPQSVNVGFAQVLDAGRIRLRVYERGSGETLACGSGAAAAVAVLRRRGVLAGPVAVELPGGTLGVDWAGPGTPSWLSGPTRFVFEGEWRDE
jgi:diaminopimelate epimerase